MTMGGPIVTGDGTTHTQTGPSRAQIRRQQQIEAARRATAASAAARKKANAINDAARAIAKTDLDLIHQYRHQGHLVSTQFAAGNAAADATLTQKPFNPVVLADGPTPVGTESTATGTDTDTGPPTATGGAGMGAGNNDNGGGTIVGGADDSGDGFGEETTPGGEGPIPLGFSSAAQFGQFGTQLYNGLSDAGFENTQAAFQGSSVTGSSFDTGEPFDLGRTSDYDIALGGEDIFGAAQESGIGLRGGGIRTGPLSDADLEQLGLTQLANELSSTAGRSVNFMIYRSLQVALGRSASIEVPGP